MSNIFKRKIKKKKNASKVNIFSHKILHLHEFRKLLILQFLSIFIIFVCFIKI